MICRNKRAHHDYALEQRYEAGIVLTGTEVKSCRAGKAQLNQSYVQVNRGEAFLHGAHIAEYTQGNRFNHEPERPRKLLLHRSEIDKLDSRIRERGLSLIPLSMYFKNGHVKVEVALGKGRAHEDRRQHIKERETNRDLQRVMRRGRR